MSDVDHVVVQEYDHEWQPPEDCGVVVTHLHYDFPTAAILKRLTEENRVPVLVLADGVLEYRNTFQNPTVAAGSLFMPIHGHKMACIGESQVRHINAWGNVGKGELVGLPRLDSFKNAKMKEANEDEVTFLVMTARQPGFTDKQLETVQMSMVDLRNWFSSHQSVAGKTINVIWRLTGDLDNQIGVVSESDPPLIELLEKVDAVVTTPSTTVIESMAMSLPTAVIDYTNSPKYVPTAWTISGPSNLDPIMQELSQPSTAHLLFQQTSFADTLAYMGTASSRMVKLMGAMMDCRKKSIAENSPLEFPNRILAVDDPGAGGATTEQSLQDLYPSQIGFRANELESLTTQYDQLCREVNVLHGRIDDQRTQLALARQDTRMAWRHHDYVADQVKWLRAEIQRLNLALRISRRPTRLHRRVRVRASIAFQRWQFFVDRMQKETRLQKPLCKLDALFEMTRFPKGVKLPATVTNYEANKKRNPQIKMWKQKPANSLLRRIYKETPALQKRSRARRVMNAR